MKLSSRWFSSIHAYWFLLVKSVSTIINTSSTLLTFNHFECHILSSISFSSLISIVFIANCLDVLQFFVFVSRGGVISRSLNQIV